jgi:hypothetical protein
MNQVPTTRAGRLNRAAYLACQASDMGDMTRARAASGIISDRQPLAYPAAGAALTRCVVRTAILLLRRKVHLPAERVGTRLEFAIAQPDDDLMATEDAWWRPVEVR